MYDICSRNLFVKTLLHCTNSNYLRDNDAISVIYGVQYCNIRTNYFEDWRWPWRNWKQCSFRGKQLGIYNTYLVQTVQGSFNRQYCNYLILVLQSYLSLVASKHLLVLLLAYLPFNKYLNISAVIRKVAVLTTEFRNTWVMLIIKTLFTIGIRRNRRGVDDICITYSWCKKPVRVRAHMAECRAMSQQGLRAETARAPAFVDRERA